MSVVARVLTAVVGVPAIILLTMLGGLPFLFLVGLLSLVGLQEFYRLTHVPHCLEVWGYAAGGLVILGVFHGWTEWSLGSVVLLVSLLLLVLVSFPRLTFEQAGSTVLGVLYVPFLFSYLLRLRALPGGAGYTLLAFSLTWACDTLAFLVGARWGRRRLAPRLSPRKTWEGAVAGVAGSVLLLLAVHSWFRLGLYPAAVLGVIAALAAEAGDLVESALKRLAGVKDAGNILPGHGGILDRFDGLLLVAPVVYTWFHWWF